MPLSEIRIHTPGTIAEALRLLADLSHAWIMAGGTDLLVDIKQGLVKAKEVISLQNIEELKGIKKTGNRIRIGALSTSQDILSSAIINRHIPALAEAAGSMASVQIRNLATVGGNIASAVPSADLPPTLIAADASVELKCAKSSREIRLYEFFTGPRETVCRSGELLAAVLVPLLPPNSGISYQKYALREANALAVASVASRLTLRKEKIEKAVIVLGAVAPIPLLASESSACLQGKIPSQDIFEKAADMASREGKPISDIRGSAWYRKELVRTLTRRSLFEALARAREKSKESR